MNKIISGVAVLFVLILAMPFLAYGADDIYRFTHNGHDTLIIGEVIGWEEGKLNIRPDYYVVSTSSMGEHEQLRPAQVRIVDVKSRWESFNAGDKIIASLYQTETEHEFTCWPDLYTLDGNDYRTAKIYDGDRLLPEQTEFLNNGVLYGEETAVQIESLLNTENTEQLFVREMAIIYSVDNLPTEKGNFFLWFMLGIAMASVIMLVFLIYKKKRPVNETPRSKPQGIRS